MATRSMFFWTRTRFHALAGFRAPPGKVVIFARLHGHHKRAREFGQILERKQRCRHGHGSKLAHTSRASMSTPRTPEIGESMATRRLENRALAHVAAKSSSACARSDRRLTEFMGPQEQ